MDINSYSDFRQTRTMAFNFCRWMLKWGSFAWHPKTMSIAHVPKDNARPSSTCKGIVWKYTVHPLVQEIPFKERGWQEIVGKDFFKESYGCASPTPRLQWEGGRAAAPFLELVSEAVAEQPERIKSDTAIRDTGGPGYEKRPWAEKKQPMTGLCERCNCIPTDGRSEVEGLWYPETRCGTSSRIFWNGDIHRGLLPRVWKRPDWYHQMANLQPWRGQSRPKCKVRGIGEAATFPIPLSARGRPRKAGWSFNLNEIWSFHETGPISF